MKELFYHPELNEFYDGAIFYISKWQPENEEPSKVKCVFNTSSFENVFNCETDERNNKVYSVPDCVYMKNVDGVDLESIGFKLDKKKMFKNWTSPCNGYNIYEWLGNWIIVCVFTSDEEHTDVVFCGTIKNINEMTKVLNQVGIPLPKRQRHDTGL